MIIISIFILCLIIISFPINLSVQGMISFFDNKGFVKVDLFGMNLMTLSIHHKVIENKSCLVIKSMMKDKILHINMDKNDKYSIMQLFSSGFIPVVDIISMDIDVCIGKSNDAFFTAMSIGFIKILIINMFSYFNSKQIVKINEHLSGAFDEDKLKIAFFGIIDVTIADIIYSMIKSTIKKLNKIKLGGKKIGNR